MRSRGKRWLVPVCLLAPGAAVVLALASGSQAGRASALDGAPPVGGKPPPAASKIKPCAFVTGKAAVINKFAEPKGTICGSQQADRITATGGAAYIETFGGVDYVNARNGKPDEIWNGSGLDGGLFDSCDRVYDLDKGEQSTAKCPGVTAGTSGFRMTQGRRFPFQLPSISCDSAGGGRRFRFSGMPIMRAVDATRNVDWQNVAWSALLFQRTETGWTLRAQTEWLWDRAYDEQVKAFPGNTWRSFVQNTRREFSEIRQSEPGAYRVAFHFKWYGAEGVPDRELKVWAGRLFRALRRHARRC
jgi:hypothetical protein